MSKSDELIKQREEINAQIEVALKEEKAEAISNKQEDDDGRPIQRIR